MASIWSDRDLSAVDAGRLSQLWSAAVEAAPAEPAGTDAAAAPAWQPGDLADALRRHLASRPDPTADGPLPETWADLLAHPTPPADRLRRLKDWAKPRMARDDGQVPPAVAGVLYFAAVAAGRLGGAAGVSNLTDDRVADGAAWALRMPWLDPVTRILFLKTAATLGPPARPRPARPRPQA